jgi:dynein heavy chain
VVEKERPDLEEQRRQLLQSHAAYQRQLKAAEEALLHLVSAASGTILDDAALEDALTAAAGTYESIQVGTCLMCLVSV